jgi:hypothetical protein
VIQSCAAWLVAVPGEDANSADAVARLFRIQFHWMSPSLVGNLRRDVIALVEASLSRQPHFEGHVTACSQCLFMKALWLLRR